jgi:hypothetical protein
MLRKRIASSLLSLALVGLMTTPAHASEQKPINLYVTQTDNPDPATESSFVAYTLKIGNYLPEPANRITVSLSLDVGHYISGSGHSWVCTLGATTGTCNHVGALPASTDSDQLVITVQAPSVQSPSSMTNTAVVSTSDPDYVEQYPSDNTSTQKTTVNPGPDAAVAQTDDPDTPGNRVTAGNTVRYLIAANNNGSLATGPGVKVTATVSTGSITGWSGTDWSCSASSVRTETCVLPAGIGPNTSAPLLQVFVRTPFSTTDYVMYDTATISTASGDTNKANNTDVEDTTVVASGEGSATGYVPPSGGEDYQVTTCTPGSPNSQDTTCAAIQMPVGPGGTVTLEEGDPIPICQSVTCFGNSVNVIVPDGYDADITFSNAIKIFLRIDSSAISGGDDSSRIVYVEKDGGNDAISMPKCTARVPTLPCINNQTRIPSSAGSYYQGTIEMFSGDPIFDAGDTVNKVTR